MLRPNKSRSAAPRRLRGQRAGAALVLFKAGYSFRHVARLLSTSTSRVTQIVRVALVVLLTVLPAAAQGISIPNTFSNGTAADATQVNANFAALAANALNRTGGTMSGTLTTFAVVPDADNTRDLGSAALSYKSAWFDGTLTVGGVAGGVVPTGLIAHFNLAACPTGWTDRTATQQGLYWVAKFAAQASGTVVGTALTSGENRAVGQHLHVITTQGIADPGPGALQVAIPGGAGSMNSNNTGAVAGTNAPYVVYIACEKN